MNNLVLILLVILYGCSSIQRGVLRASSPLFLGISNDLSRERNWEFFREAAPGDLKFLEVLYLQDKQNLGLLTTVIKGYAGYTYAVSETLAFGDEIAGVESSIHKQNAIVLYTKSLDYGLEYLRLKGIQKKELLDLDEAGLTKLLSDKLSRKDLTAVLFFAQSWGSLINLQKDNVALVAHVPKVKTIFDWICSKDAQIENGVCDIFYAQYEAARPRMLGGNPEKARELYKVAINKRPKHLLMRLGFIQYCLLPAYDKEAYEKESIILREELAKWENLNRDNLEDTSEYKAVEQLNLFNAIAKKRFELIEKNKLKIFEG